MKQELSPAITIGGAVLALVLIVAIGWKLVVGDKPQALDAKGIVAARERKEQKEDRGTVAARSAKERKDDK